METIILKLGLAMAIGLLVGLERGWREREAPAGSRTAGIRTFGISGLLGGIIAALGEAAGSPWLLPVGFFSFTLVFGLFKWHESTHDEDFSFTGVAAAMAVFLLGAYAMVGDQVTAAAGGAALAALLASRNMLHGLLRKLSWIEVRAALTLAVMTAIVLPLLPSTPVDPWGALILREIWLFTLLAAALSYFGYIATRMFGAKRGLIFGCLAGALVSSTLMTLTLARTPGNGRQLAGAASLAAMVSILRIQLMTAVVAPGVLVITAPAALAAAAVFGLGGWLMLGGMSESDMPEAPNRNPFDIGPLMIFAAVFALVSLLSALTSLFFGSGALAVTAAISGMVDADAAALSVLRLGADAELVGRAVLAALASNATVRFLGGAAVGPMRFWLPLAMVNIAAIVAAGTVFVFLPMSGDV